MSTTSGAPGRHLSFTKAADELCVTQGAVSRQIRELEGSLGLQLFRRDHRSVDLTPDGRRYHHAVTVALEYLVDATVDLVAQPSDRPSYRGHYDGRFVVLAHSAATRF